MHKGKCFVLFVLISWMAFVLISWMAFRGAIRRSNSDILKILNYSKVHARWGIWLIYSNSARKMGKKSLFNFFRQLTLRDRVKFSRVCTVCFYQIIKIRDGSSIKIPSTERVRALKPRARASTSMCSYFRSEHRASTSEHFEHLSLR